MAVQKKLPSFALVARKGAAAFGVSCVGMGALFVFVSAMNNCGEMLGLKPAVGILYCARSLGLILSMMVFHGLVTHGKQSLIRKIDAVATLGIAAVAIGCVMTGREALALFLLGAALSSWVYFRWALTFAGMDLRRVSLVLCFACEGWQLAIRLVALASWATVAWWLFGVLVFVSVLSLWLCDEGEFSGPKNPKGSPADRGDVVKVLAAIAAVGFVLSFLMQLLRHQAEGADAANMLSVAASVVAILVYLCAQYQIGVRNGLIGFSTLWRFIVVCVSLALLVADFGMIQIAWVTSMVAWDILMPIAWLSACMLARLRGNGFTLVGFGLVAFLLPMGVGNLTGEALEGVAALQTLGPCSIFGLLAVSLACLNARDPGTQHLLDDITVFEDSSHFNERRSVLERCEMVGPAYGLTPREIEVMSLVCQGRTRDYMAETLFISKNTVKTHVASIYAKTSSHSRTDLQRLLDSESQ